MSEKLSRSTSVSVATRLSREENQALDAAATAARQNRSTWLRETILSHLAAPDLEQQRRPAHDLLIGLLLEEVLALKMMVVTQMEPGHAMQVLASANSQKRLCVKQLLKENGNHHALLR